MKLNILVFVSAVGWFFWGVSLMIQIDPQDTISTSYWHFTLPVLGPPLAMGPMIFFRESVSQFSVWQRTIQIIPLSFGFIIPAIYYSPDHGRSIITFFIDHGPLGITTGMMIVALFAIGGWRLYKTFQI